MRNGQETRSALGSVNGVEWCPTFLAPGIDFTEDSFYTDQGWRQGNGFSMIQAHYILHVISNLMLLLI